MSVSIPAVNGNSQSPPRAAIVPCLAGQGVFPLSGLRSRFPVLPFDLVSHGPGAGLPQRRNSRLRDGVMSFFQRTCWPGWQWRGLFLVPVLLLPSGRQVLERAWSGDAAKASCRWENPGPGSGTKPGNMKASEPAIRHWVQDQPWMKTWCKSRKWHLCWEIG